MQSNSETALSPRQVRDFQAIAGLMIPASTEYGVPGADDATIFADILRSLGRDRDAVCSALDRLAERSGGAFSDLDAVQRQTVADGFLAGDAPEVAVFGRVVLQCYYRDDRVVRSLGMEPRPPFPKGHVVEQGDWSLLDPVRARAKLWRDAP